MDIILKNKTSKCLKPVLGSSLFQVSHQNPVQKPIDLKMRAPEVQKNKFPGFRNINFSSRFGPEKYGDL